MDKEQMEKQITAILYKHTCHVDMHINEIDYEEVTADLVKLFAIPVVVFSDQQERSRFQKDIDDCYTHEDEEDNEAEVCLAPSYRIIGCEYNDGRTCDGCKWLPKQT